MASNTLIEAIWFSKIRNVNITEVSYEKQKK